MDLFQTVSLHASKISDTVDIRHGLRFVNNEDDQHFLYNEKKIAFIPQKIEEHAISTISTIAELYGQEIHSFVNKSNDIQNSQLKNIIDKYTSLTKNTDRLHKLQDHLELSLNTRYAAQLLAEQSNIILSSDEKFAFQLTKNILRIQNTAEQGFNEATDSINYIQKEAQGRGWYNPSILDLEELYTPPKIKTTQRRGRKGVSA